MNNVEKIKPTGLFTNYIYKAIPLAFDESMSYYETLCGLLSYLKDTVIPTVNNNADAIVEVQNLMQQLQDYVDNYFKNLDVQQEINNKLDEMTQDGTLTNLIKSYINPIYQEYEETINNQIELIDNKVTSIASGSPLVASSISEMTDTTRIYVNTSNGHWYWYDGTNWQDGGIYQATEIPNGSVTPIKTNFMEQINQMPSSNWVLNKILIYTSGIESDFNGASYCTNLIEIPENETKIIMMTHKAELTKGVLYYYDETQTFLSAQSNLANNPISFIPENAKYYRVGFQNQLGNGDYLLFYMNDFLNGLNIYNQGKLKNDYINFAGDKILYNLKHFNIIPHAYGDTIANPTINGNKVNYNFTNQVTGNEYIGTFVNWDIKIGDTITIEVNNNFPYTKFLIFTTKNNRIDANTGGNLGEIPITNNKATLTIDETLYNRIVDNILLFTFQVPSSQVGTLYDFDIKYSLNDDYYYFKDFIEDNYIPQKEYKALFLGDSITAMTNQNENWTSYFKQILNITESNNVAVNGARLRDFNDTVYDGNPINHSHNNVLGNQVQKIINNQSTYVNPDFIFIAIGTNDGINTTLNDACNVYYNSDGVIPINNVDRTTDAGAFRYCNEKLHNLYPNAMIVWFTPIQANYISRPAKNIINYGESLKILCSVGSVYCIDTEKCGINGINEIRNSNGEYLQDGLHPNSNGAKLIGTFNAKEFKKFI